jgi:catechol 2,3-dioxygenase-like lactoylglutathione lyase family enzyme
MRRFDHIDLRAPSLSEVEEFYRALLPALGFTENLTVPGWLQFYAAGDGPSEFFGVTESAAHVPNENRIAFWAESPAEVDKLAELLRIIGAKSIEGPGFDEGPTYYAVFFEDPVGNRLEVCHRLEN